MDKKTFISELEQALSVLQEEELRDIMEEYEQHIDMKVQRGLTEEEAIADFGNLKELTAEILEAYHVRRDYALVREDTGKKRYTLMGEEKGSSGEAVKRGPDIRKAGVSFRNFCANQGRKAGDCFRSFAGKKTGEKEYGEETTEDKAERGGNLSGAGRFPGGSRLEMIWKAFGRGAERLRYFIVSCFKWGWRTAGRLLRAGWHLALDWGGRLWSGLSWCIRHGTQIAFACARIVWNCGWIFFAALCAAAGIGTLFGLGMLAVLLAQGYPLAGITLGLLGLNVSLFSAAGLGLSFIWRKRTSRNLLETGTRETELSLYRDCSWEEEEDHA